ncbi:MAG: lytic transglycosylase domain-containing protein [Desulfobacterales bacterium]|nr:lytic transglycosylase domain-containing protein [Desulfobacterales bacterium]
MVFIGIYLFLSIYPNTSYGSDIYIYIDPNGIKHFTNIPSSSKYKKYRPYLHNDYILFRKKEDPKKYDSHIREASEIYGVDFSLVKAIIKVESNFNPRAVSRAGALGLMQIMPNTVDYLDIKNPFDSWENIMGGTRYFKLLYEKFNGELSLALAAYNAGPANVERYNGIPPFDETLNYVKRVIRYYRIFNKSID